jgi:hypothetical protein
MDRPARSGYGGFARDLGTVLIRRYQPHVLVRGKEDAPTDFEQMAGSLRRLGEIPFDFAQPGQD